MREGYHGGYDGYDRYDRYDGSEEPAALVIFFCNIRCVAKKTKKMTNARRFLEPVVPVAPVVPVVPDKLTRAMVVLGIDAGGTKTVCQVADGDGKVLAESRGPGANLVSLGEQRVEAALRAAIDPVLADRPDRIDAVCLGMAGVDQAREAETVRGVLSRIGHFGQTLVVSDSLIALEAGAPDSPGVVVASGTGSIAYGRDAAGRAARSGGWGFVLADEGSAFWLGKEAIRAVLRAADRRGPGTSLTGPVLRHFG